jgi:SAM-dependent methyltransferase
MAPLYGGYEEVVFFDYALSQLRQGQELWGDASPAGDTRYVYVAGDFYALPFVSGAFDAVTMIRSLHHASDGATVLRGVGGILGPGGTFVLEFASKHNLKAIARYLVGRQDWSPFAREPVEFTDLNFDFHPAWILEQLAQSGLHVRRVRTVSHLRVGVLKRAVPTGLLVALDRMLQPTGKLFQLSPSVFVQSQAPSSRSAAAEGDFFRCVACGAGGMEEVDEGLMGCRACGARYAIRDGIFDFRVPVEGEVA